jgi:glutathionylspermidine synthase
VYLRSVVHLILMLHKLLVKVHDVNGRDDTVLRRVQVQNVILQLIRRVVKHSHSQEIHPVIGVRMQMLTDIVTHHRIRLLEFQSGPTTVMILPKRNA